MTIKSAEVVRVEAVGDGEAIVLSNPLTANGVSARRLKAGQLIAGVAAATSSENFKGPVSGISRNSIR